VRDEAVPPACMDQRYDIIHACLHCCVE
jgi:hypothetical protein